MKRIITHANDLSVFSGVIAGETDEQAFERARKFYGEDIAKLQSNLERNPEQAEYWNKRIKYYRDCIEHLQIETQDEYFARVRKSYLDNPAKEITEEHFFDALEVLPPCAWTNNGRFERFYIAEANHLTFHSFYLHDHETGKYWTKICDACDRSTWIECALGIVLPPPPAEIKVA